METIKPDRYAIGNLQILLFVYNFIWKLNKADVPKVKMVFFLKISVEHYDMRRT